MPEDGLKTFFNEPRWHEDGGKDRFQTPSSDADFLLCLCGEKKLLLQLRPHAIVLGVDAFVSPAF